MRLKKLPISVGDIVRHTGVNRLLVVDVNPENVCTPQPCAVVAWREGNKIQEAVVEMKYLQLLQGAK